jgi:two-component system response regulator NreC
MDMPYPPNESELTLEKNKSAKRITIVLADERSVSRQKLRSLLDLEPDLQVIGEINNGLDALDMVGNLHPDILVFALNASNNKEIIRLVNLNHPKTAVVIPYQIGYENRAKELLGNGVKACILKKSAETELADAIRYVNDNNNDLSKRTLRPVTQNHAREGADYTHDPIETLTARERQVFDLVVREMTNAQIAARLSISRRTVEIHRAKILLKLGLRNQHQQLLNYATEHGIVFK